ncbi:MAG: TAXI family TRAP transporter solute-binding subunit [Rhodospirillales bacterium]|jgi:hypothetical protein|nr:TAXI family TRAP transporter solute-binding subunit [Rhodospirillales bacterium]
MTSIGRVQLAGALLAGVITIAAFDADAQDTKFFRIGTGGVGGTYYPIGGIIANAISNPPGSSPCDKGGSCGVPGLLAIAQSSHGSVDNIDAVLKGAIESVFAQSDIVFWAYTGTGTYKRKKPAKNLRVIANLYPESVHLVARKGAGIAKVGDLKGKRVSPGERGSGTLVDSRLILKAYRLKEKRDFKALYLKNSTAARRLGEGKLDAFFAVAGYPQPAVANAVGKSGAVLVPLAGREVDRLLKSHQFFARDLIPGGTYKGVSETPTIAVNALWIVSEAAADELIYRITKALWNAQTRKLLDGGHAKGRLITIDTALDGIGIPLHEGAERYYREVGRLK